MVKYDSQCQWFHYAKINHVLFTEPKRIPCDLLMFLGLNHTGLEMSDTFLYIYGFTPRETKINSRAVSATHVMKGSSRNCLIEDDINSKPAVTNVMTNACLVFVFLFRNRT